MIILLHGPDTYRSRAKANEIIGAYRAKYGASLAETCLSAPNFPAPKNFWRDVSRPTLFTPKRLMVLERASEQPGFLEELFGENEMSMRDEHTTLLFWEEKTLSPKSKEAKNLFAQEVRAQEFRHLAGNAFRAFVSRMAEGVGAQFLPAALTLFSAWREGDTWGAANDLQILRWYCHDRPVQVEDVRLFVRPSLEARIFATLDDLFGGRKKEGIASLQEYFAAGEEAVAALGMFAWHLRTLALVKEGSDKEAGVHPFVARKMGPLARRVSFDVLRAGFAEIAATDRAIKTGALEGRLAVELLALKIAQMCRV